MVYFVWHGLGIAVRVLEKFKHARGHVLHVLNAPQHVHRSGGPLALIGGSNRLPWGLGSQLLDNQQRDRHMARYISYPMYNQQTIRSWGCSDHLLAQGSHTYPLLPLPLFTCPPSTTQGRGTSINLATMCPTYG